MKDQGDPNVGDAIRAAREAKRLTRKEVAEAIDISDQYLYQVETGRRSPGLELLWDLAIVLDVDPHSFDARLMTRKPPKR